MWLLSGGSVQGQQQSVTLLLGGDVMLGNWVTDHLDRDGFDYPFRAVKPVLDSADIRFCNLETPIGTADSTMRTDKTYTFALPPKYREALRHGNFDVVSLANNHILDYGHALADSTLHYLHQLGISGVGYGQSSMNSAEPTILERNGFRVGFLAYSMTFPSDFWATDSTPGTAYPDENNFVRIIESLDAQVDFTVLSFHWGAENSDSTKAYQQVFAHSAIDAGADLVVGHHPHVWQGLEAYRGRLIAYSLGNFCFGSFSKSAVHSGLLEVRAARDSVLAARIHPLNVENVTVRFQPQPLTPDKSGHFFSALTRYSARFDSISVVTVDKNGKISWE